jgi:heat shock protein HslJ
MEATMIRPSKTLAAVLLIAVSLVALAGCLNDGSALDGTHWRLTEWTLSSLDPADFTITVQFADGQISGHSGVNTYGGPYKLGRGDAFSAGLLACTEMAGQEPAMRAEAAYLTLLDQAKSYKMADRKLTLYDKGGNESLIFEAAGK